jgi:hypothetical protein
MKIFILSAALLGAAATTGKVVETRHELYQIGIEESAAAH